MKRKIYQPKKFNNPYFARKKSRFSLPQGKKIFIISGLILCFISLAIINNLNFLKISNIRVAGNEFISDEEIKAVIEKQISKKRFLFFSQKNILFFNKYQAKRLLNKMYSLQDLKVSKKYFNTVDVWIKEKTTSIIFINNQGKFNLDENGVAIKKYELGLSDQKERTGSVEIIRPLSASTDLAVVMDKSNTDIQIGKEVLPKKTVDYILSLQDELKKSADFDILQYSIENPESDELTLATSEGWELRVKSTGTVSKQIYLLNLVLQEKIKDRNTLHYIDLRFGDKINYQ
ncbi:MAG: FtsQ-type POTRA domain-containing protein [Candidatus Buchananbacteria bacterium]